MSGKCLLFPEQSTEGILSGILCLSVARYHSCHTPVLHLELISQQLNAPFVSTVICEVLFAGLIWSWPAVFVYSVLFSRFLNIVVLTLSASWILLSFHCNVLGYYWSDDKKFKVTKYYCWPVVCCWSRLETADLLVYRTHFKFKAEHETSAHKVSLTLKLHIHWWQILYLSSALTDGLFSLTSTHTVSLIKSWHFVWMPMSIGMMGWQKLLLQKLLIN